jgi:hypothetical protein
MKMFIVAVNLNITIPWFIEGEGDFDIGSLFFVIPKNHPCKVYGVSFIADLLAAFFKGAAAQQRYVHQLLSIISEQKARLGLFNNQYSYHTEQIFCQLEKARQNLPLAASQIVVIFHIIIVLTYTTTEFTPFQTALYRFACAVMRPFHLLLADRVYASTSATKDNEDQKDMAKLLSTYWHYIEHWPVERSIFGSCLVYMIEGIADKACGDWKRKLRQSAGHRGAHDLENCHSYMEADKLYESTFGTGKSTRNNHKKERRVVQTGMILVDPRFENLPGMKDILEKIWADCSCCYYKMPLQLTPAPQFLWVICSQEDRPTFTEPNGTPREVCVQLLKERPDAHFICACNCDSHETDCIMFGQ